ncbi:MAG TPA: secretin N-terminal domain-containing protein [Planctomycetota bacterium]|nr:secretin N-terminal domain-containing protein [Planctomycetota bacterium]
MKLISIAALSLLSSCCALHRAHPESTTASSAASATKEEVAYKVIPLRFAAASEMASVLRNSVLKQNGRRAPQIIADDRTNSVVVSCAPDQLSSVEKLIAELDVEVKKQQ